MWDSFTTQPKLVVGHWLHALDRKQAAFRRGYDPSFPKELYQITDVLVKDKQITYKLRDLWGNQLPSGYYIRNY